MTTIKKILELGHIQNFTIDSDDEGRITLAIYDARIGAKELPTLIENTNHVLQLVAKREHNPSIYVDINNYRRERERIIKDLARAGARKALAANQSIELPPMNAYERRLVHVELAVHPNVRTESAGERRARHVIIFPLDA